MSDETFMLPDLGEGLQEAEIVSWHVSVGDHVVADQPIVSVETDKAVVEVPSPHAGRVATLHAAPGDRVAVGAPLVSFEASPHEDAGGIVGEIKKESPAARRPASRQREGGRVRTTPAVRALARKLGVDLDIVQPSGPKGTVTGADVERAAKILAEAGPLEPLHGVRRAMAERMAQAHAEVVPATVMQDADVGDWPEDANVTIRLARAVAAACKAEGALNAWLDGDSLGRRLHMKVDLGIAVNTDDGLFVPVLRDVGNRTAESLRDGLASMKEDVRKRSIPLEEMRGATITLSNFGMLAGRYANLVVVPPQVAIVGAGMIEPRIVARDGVPVVRRMLPLSVTFDHRAVTGAEAAGFLAAMIADLGRPD